MRGGRRLSPQRQAEYEEFIKLEDHILELLLAAGYTKAEALRLLGLAKTTLYYRRNPRPKRAVQQPKTPPPKALDTADRNQIAALIRAGRAEGMSVYKSFFKHLDSDDPLLGSLRGVLSHQQTTHRRIQSSTRPTTTTTTTDTHRHQTRRRAVLGYHLASRILCHQGLPPLHSARSLLPQNRRPHYPTTPRSTYRHPITRTGHRRRTLQRRRSPHPPHRQRLSNDLHPNAAHARYTRRGTLPHPTWSFQRQPLRRILPPNPQTPPI